MALGSAVGPTSAGWSIPVGGCVVVLRLMSVSLSWWEVEKDGVAVVGSKAEIRRIVPIA